MDRWVGRTAVVTGASAGIGAAIAVALADAGVNVVGLARRPHLVEELEKQRTAGKGKMIGKKCDVSSSEDIIKVFASINEQFGGINILVNNAGISELGTLTDAGENVVSDEAIERVLKTNTLGMVICSREAVKYMKKTGELGHIVNINSIGGLYVPAALGLPRFNIYYGSKQAVQATSEAMRLEFSHTKANIKITCVSPAGVRTDMTNASARHKSCPAQEVSPHAPLPAIGLLEAKDIADAVLSVLATPPRVNFVTSTFWGLYSVDRELISPKIIELTIPFWVNHSTHTVILVVVLLDLVLQPGEIPLNDSKNKITIFTFVLVYQIVLLCTYLEAGYWIYPLYNLFNVWQYIMFSFYNFVAYRVGYELQWPLTRWTRKLRETKTLKTS